MTVLVQSLAWLTPLGKGTRGTRILVSLKELRASGQRLSHLRGVGPKPDTQPMSVQGNPTRGRHPAIDIGALLRDVGTKHHGLNAAQHASRTIITGQE